MKFKEYLGEMTVKINGLRAKPIKKKYMGRKLARGMDMRNMGDYFAQKDDGTWEEIPSSLVEGGDPIGTGMGKTAKMWKKMHWEQFYTAAKDTRGGKRFKEFEKKYGNVTNIPHIADALDKTKNFGDFYKMINKFER